MCDPSLIASILSLLPQCKCFKKQRRTRQSGRDASTCNQTLSEMHSCCSRTHTRTHTHALTHQSALTEEEGRHAAHTRPGGAPSSRHAVEPPRRISDQLQINPSQKHNTPQPRKQTSTEITSRRFHSGGCGKEGGA